MKIDNKESGDVNIREWLPNHKSTQNEHIIHLSGFSVRSTLGQG